MALCEFSKLVGGPCSGSTDYPSNVACVSIGEYDRDVKGHLKFCKISGDFAERTSQGCSLLEQVSNNCHILLCYVSDIVFIAYGYVAMINSQSLRGHWGLQCCGVAVFFLCVCRISVSKSHRAVSR